MLEHVSPNCTCPGKQCTSCEATLCCGKFSKNNKAKDKLESSCKACKKTYMEHWRANNTEHRKQYDKEYAETHKEPRRKVRKKWRRTHKEAVKQHNKTYRARHPARIRQRKHNYYQVNRKRILNKNKSYYQDHKEERSLYGKNWRATNAEYLRLIKHLDYLSNIERYSARGKANYTANREVYLQRRKARRKANIDGCRTRDRNYYHSIKEILLPRKRERNRKNRIENPEQCRAYSRKYHASSKGQQRQQRYYQDNRESIILQTIRYRKQNPEITIVAHSRRRARVAMASGSFTKREWLFLKRKYSFTCLCCGKREPDIRLTADHVIPLSKGGSNGIENIQPLCQSCNSRKHTKTIDYRSKAA